MGRSSKNEETNDSVDTSERSSKGFQRQEEYHTGSTKALSESESMARDIKDGRLNGFVGHGTVLTGETYFNSMLRVDGHVTGKVISEDGTLLVGSTGQVDANVVVAGAIVNGLVNGDIIATEKLELGRTARVVGNIQSPRLIIEDGAILEGNCSMVQQKEQLEQEAAVAEEETAIEGQYEIRESSEDVEELTTYETEEDSSETDAGDPEEETADAAGNL